MLRNRIHGGRPGKTSEIISPKQFNLEEYLFLRDLGMTTKQISISWMWNEIELITIAKIKINQQ